ncbi:hypothetical protein CKO12_08460 [Chromatium okenii]|uniref:STAS domain-containing protein n=1 Tax=Chromatium okenii TaxID=61644 RepID=UPI001903D381|nr:STAS domain-containing protein [Chromatium okenii]MBK1641902.1 hypothetical protein [Chromatium okenii]
MSAESALVLEGEMTIYTAAAIRTQLQDYVTGRQHCVLDLTAVSEIDSAGLQLLLWVRRVAAEQRADFQLRSISPPVAQVLELLQLEQGLNLKTSDAARKQHES